MAIYFGVFGIVIAGLLLTAWMFFGWVQNKIKQLEKRIINNFISRSDCFPALYEVTLPYITRHSEVFQEIMELRKKEFHVIKHNLDLGNFVDLESHIHHELNFIFQICNKHPLLIKEKKFLYLRDIVLDKSAKLGKSIQTYKKATDIYNSYIKIKNMSLIGLILPFSSKINVFEN